MLFFFLYFFFFFVFCSASFQSSASSLSVPVTSTVNVKGFCSFPVCLCVSIMLTWLSYGNRNKDNLLLLSTSAFYWVSACTVSPGRETKSHFPDLGAAAKRLHFQILFSSSSHGIYGDTWCIQLISALHAHCIVIFAEMWSFYQDKTDSKDAKCILQYTVVSIWNDGQLEWPLNFQFNYQVCCFPVDIANGV